ncbi:MAG TPA: trypsin-like peptidase domain-containing protein [Egibacteraceae bacterium]
MPDTTYPPTTGGWARPDDELGRAQVRDDTLRLPEPPPPPPRDEDRRGSGGGWRPILAAALVAALVSAVVTGVGITAFVDDDSQPAAEAPAADDSGDSADSSGSGDNGGSQPVRIDGGESTVAAVAEQVLPTVARVDVVGARGTGSGSAVIFREDGYLLTNNHVVDGAESVQVTLPDGSPEEAEIIGTVPESDLAVLHVDATGLPVPAFAEEPPEVGDTAIAIGSPFGLDSTVTAGIVSAVNRTIPGAGMPLTEMIQTDAAINPGNSGGALVNANAEVIGINTAILSQTGTYSGVGFAIPIDTALDAAEQLVEQGYVEYAQLGIRGQDVDPQIAEMYGLDVQSGAIVADVEEGSAAEEAGLQRGDIITAIDGEPVDSMAGLATKIRSMSPGDEVELTIVRDGEEQTVTATLGSARSSQSEEEPQEQQGEPQLPFPFGRD